MKHKFFSLERKNPFYFSQIHMLKSYLFFTESEIHSLKSTEKEKKFLTKSENRDLIRFKKRATLLCRARASLHTHASETDKIYLHESNINNLTNSEIEALLVDQDFDAEWMFDILISDQDYIFKHGWDKYNKSLIVGF